MCEWLARTRDERSHQPDRSHADLASRGSRQLGLEERRVHGDSKEHKQQQCTQVADVSEFGNLINAAMDW